MKLIITLVLSTLAAVSTFAQDLKTEQICKLRIEYGRSGFWPSEIPHCYNDAARVVDDRIKDAVKAGLIEEPSPCQTRSSETDEEYAVVKNVAALPILVEYLTFSFDHSYNYVSSGRYDCNQ